MHTESTVWNTVLETWNKGTERTGDTSEIHILSHHQQPYKYHTFHAYVVVGHAARLIYLLFCFKMHLQKSFCLLDRSSLRMLYLVAIR